MNTTKKILLTALMIVLSAPTMFAQYEWQMSPKPNEEYVGMVTSEEYAGGRFYSTDGRLFSENGQTSINHQFTKTDEELHEILLKKARAIYGSQYSYYTISLRNFKASISEKRYDMPDAHQYRYDRYYKISAAVVVPANTKSTNSTSDMEDEGDDLTKALDKALQDIREGSRIAIDQVKVPSGTNTLLLQLEKVKYFCKRNNNINKLNQKRGNGGTTNAQRQVTTHCLILAPAALLKHQPI